MSTALVYGNGSMLVNVNDRLNISDLYWPHVGQENHLNEVPNQIFLRVDGALDMLTDWDMQPVYMDDSLVGESTASNPNKHLSFRIKEAVLSDKQAFVRQFLFTNSADYTREVYLYIKSNFRMMGGDIGDTAIWYPHAGALVHYKKSRYLAIGSTGTIHQFTCASPNDNKGMGAFPDSDGQLRYNPVATGEVESCISYKLTIAPGETVSIDSFVVAGHCFDEISDTTQAIREEGIERLLESADAYWKNWVRSKFDANSDKTPQLFEEPDRNERLFSLYKRSLLTIRTQFDNDGAIIAANDSTFVKAGGKDSYSYFWPRDGALVATALIDAGFGDLVKRFFDYCKDIISSDGYILHKYHPNGRHGLASSWHPWVDKGGNLQLPIQEDETALVLYALWKHFDKFADQEFLNQMYDSFVLPAADFLVSYRYTGDPQQGNLSEFVGGFPNTKQNPIDEHYTGTGLPRPSYDIWEVERGVFSYTVATVYAGLLAAAHLAKQHGDLVKSREYRKAAQEVSICARKHLIDSDNGLLVRSIICDPLEESCYKDNRMDASMLYVWKLGLLPADDPVMQNTVAEIEKRLWLNTESGGVARHENDWYHRTDTDITGNPWYICSLWLAQYWIALGEPEKAKRYLGWVIDHADSTGLMAEQADPYHGTAMSVKPLTWSHSELVATVSMLL